MKLLFTKTSPYARKVRVVAREVGQTLTEVEAWPFDNPEELVKANPLAKVPGLVLDDGTSIIDSRVMCEMLASGTALEFSDWHARSRAAWADGVLDLALQVVMESRRTDSEISQFWMSRWREQILRTVGQMNDRVEELQRFGLPEVGWAVALSYLDFRLGDYRWQKAAPALATWHDEVRNRPSMRDTEPPDATARIPG
ncbi:MAG: glutathione S-transferase N-terminal domain-containing protein [Myxococcota bacterium]